MEIEIKYRIDYDNPREEHFSESFVHNCETLVAIKDHYYLHLYNRILARIREFACDKGFVWTLKSLNDKQNDISIRDEAEIPVANMKDAVNMLTMLGYTYSHFIDKTRYSIKTDKATVSIDDFVCPNLGKFLEIEVDTNVSADEAEQVIEEVKKALNIPDLPVVHESCFEMSKKFYTKE